MSDYTSDKSTERSKLRDLGVAALEQGKLMQAEELLRQALQQLEDEGEADDCLTRNLMKLADEYADQSLFAEAEGLGLIALKQAQANSAIDSDLHNSLTCYYDGLADTFLRQRRYGEAEKMFEQSFAIDKALSTHEDPCEAHLGWVNMASDLHNIARIVGLQGDYVRAEGLIREAMEIDLQHMEAFLSSHDESYLGPASFVIATKDIYPLAQLCALQKKYSESERLYLDALAICREHSRHDDLDVADLLDSYGLLLREMGREEEAAKTEEEANTIRRK